MTWREIFKRAYAAYKLARKKFVFCPHCGDPLTEDEGYHCLYCLDKAGNGIDDFDRRGHIVKGAWTELMKPGLREAFKEGYE